MYNYNSNNVERENEGFPWRDIIIKVLLILLFIFLLIWLVPWPKQVEQGQQGNLEPLYNQIFLDNIERMHNAAKNYYTVERLPKKVGDKVTMTLREMLDKKLLVEFTDSEGNVCDKDKSYVEVTKYDSEYALITYLSCNKKQEQIVEYLGCKNLCPLNECPTIDIVKPTPTPSNPKPSNPSKPVKPNQPDKPDKPDTPDKPVTPTKTYKYEYKRDAELTYSNWSNWSKDTLVKPNEKITYGLSANKLEEIRAVASKRVLAGYEVGYDKTKPIYQTTYDNVIGTYTLKVCDRYKYIVTTSKEVLQVGEWVAVGKPQAYTTVPKDSASVKYEYIRPEDSRCDETCKYSTRAYFQKYTRTTSKVGTTSNIQVSCAKYTTEKVNVYGERKSFVSYEKIKTPLYATLEYYQSRTRTITKNVTASTKWSTSNKDQSLLSQGYKLTGKRIEVK